MCDGKWRQAEGEDERNERGHKQARGGENSINNTSYRRADDTARGKMFEKIIYAVASTPVQ